MSDVRKNTRDEGNLVKFLSCHTMASVVDAIWTTLVFLLRLLYPILRLDSVISTSSPKTVSYFNLFNTFKIPKSCSCEGSLTICILPVKRFIGYCINSSSLSRSFNDSSLKSASLFCLPTLYSLPGSLLNFAVVCLQQCSLLAYVLPLIGMQR